MEVLPGFEPGPFGVQCDRGFSTESWPCPRAQSCPGCIGPSLPAQKCKGPGRGSTTCLGAGIQAFSCPTWGSAWSTSHSPLDLQPGSDSGTTAVVALIRGKQLIVANAGDSRCVVSESGKAVDMSYDHKPEDEVELARIKNAGGKVTMDGRVNGGLNLSRAIGETWNLLVAFLPHL